MGEEWADEQLKDFCRRHGLAKDGYLDETELTTVCKCIGIQVSGEVSRISQFRYISNIIFAVHSHELNHHISFIILPLFHVDDQRAFPGAR